MSETRIVRAGSLMIGGSWPVSVQTMWKEPLPRCASPADPALEPVIRRLASLTDLGCSMVRFAVPDMAAAEALGMLAEKSPLPLVADIHFDWRLALRCMDFPIAKIRINPGNIGAAWKVREVAAKARDRGIPLRIGINGGSLPRDLAPVHDRVEAALAAAEREIELLEAEGFRDIVVSLKMNDPEEVIRANEAFAARFPYPLHLGVTEAGPLVAGIVRNTAALVPLLKKGIGATIRVSLSDSMEHEVIAGREILACAGQGGAGVRIVSCPRCGRASFDTHAFIERWKNSLYALRVPITVAVMGCVVNGPGEAREADLGITGAGNAVLIFRQGTIIRRVHADNADQAFEEALRELVQGNDAARRAD
ncbi:MAG: flavodoxin-dependent (E)-4-hydroxy-3-methylbut-2-enyl-diphosphate synthase [Spirochaetaceae bacterium]|nr:flavodoxin-dependent (E)-4-hydroxy-3-methylbut-2-enyl-diphosphate synthase [Spirochaetaceae bacterium]